MINKRITDQNDHMKSTSAKKVKPILIRVEEDVYTFFTEEAVKKRVSVSALIRELMYVKMGERKNGD